AAMLRSPCTIDSTASTFRKRRRAARAGFADDPRWVAKVTLSASSGQMRGQTIEIQPFHRLSQPAPPLLRSPWDDHAASLPAPDGYRATDRIAVFHVLQPL